VTSNEQEKTDTILFFNKSPEVTMLTYEI